PIRSTYAPAAGRGAPIRSSASSKSQRSTTVAPRPPCSRGHAIADQPPSWSFRCHGRAISSHAGSSERDQQWSRRHSRGTFVSSQRRASSANASSRSENEKSTPLSWGKRVGGVKRRALTRPVGTAIDARVTPRSAFVAVGDVRLHYLDFGGDGFPLVFLHATGFHAWLWEPYVRRLVDRFRVLALDQRGHGESSKPASGYRWERFGADFAGALEALDLDGVRAVGHSKGGTAIAAAAAVGTDRLPHAGLVDRVLRPGPPALEPAWEAPLVVGARRRRNVWPSRDAMFETLRGKMPFETWQEEFVRLYVDHGVADRPDGQ